ncbi:hypothetical protein ACWEV3_24465 [Saccharopolyspora sp. NPDC003752]
MYAWIWRRLPGGTAAKAAQAVLLVEDSPDVVNWSFMTARRRP